jgi:hypothetical protein
MADAIAELPLTQAAGEPPAVLAAGSGPGEHGLAVFKVRFRSGVHIESPSPRSHKIQLGGDCSMHGLCRSEPLGPVGPARSRRVAYPTSVLAGAQSKQQECS